MRGKGPKLFDWVLEKKFSLWEWSGIGICCSGRWWNHHLWKCSRSMWLWPLRLWFRDNYVMLGWWLEKTLFFNLYDLLLCEIWWRKTLQKSPPLPLRIIKNRKQTNQIILTKWRNYFYFLLEHETLLVILFCRQLFLSSTIPWHLSQYFKSVA